MVIDKEGKLFGKINILDIVLLILFAAAVIFAAKALLPRFFSNESSAADTEAVYTIEVTKETEDYFENIKPGDKVFGENTDDEIGTVVSCTASPAVYIVEDKENAEYREVTVEGRYDGLVKIKSPVTVKYPDITAGTNSIKIGVLTNLRTENSLIRGYIVAMEGDFEETLKNQ